MAKKKLTKEQEQEIKYLQANNEMLERTKEEAKLRGTKKSVERIELAQQDVIEQVKKIDPSLAKKMAQNQKNTAIEDKTILNNVYDDNESIFDVLDSLKTDENEEENESDTVDNTPTTESIISEVNDTDFNNVDSDVQYDIISLPSNGECYKDKVKRIPVSYLTAYDENFITSPNLYKDGLIIEFLLKNKIMNKNIKIDELCSGDVDAIILFLRATSYGSDFPIIVQDPESGEKIETVIDLTSLKYKEFKLKGDSDGLFEFELPLSKDKIKFKFLTRKDEKALRMLNDIESEGGKARTILSNIHTISEGISSDKTLSGKEKQEHIANLNKISDWASSILEKRPLGFNKLITNKLEMSIVKVNENDDRKFISKYVKNMNAKDSLELRRYMINNEPGVDFEITVNRPASLGGGSFKTFLEWDDSVFLNI